MLHPTGCLRLCQAGAGAVFLGSEALSDCCYFALPSCWAMAGTTGGKEVKVRGPTTRGQPGHQVLSARESPPRTISTPTRIPGDRGSPGHPCGLAQAPLRGPAFFLAKCIFGALCPHFWVAQIRQARQREFPSLRIGNTKPEGRGVMKNQVSCTHFLCKEADPPLPSYTRCLRWRFAWAPMYHPCLLLTLFFFHSSSCFPFSLHDKDWILLGRIFYGYGVPCVSCPVVL